ncbi:MAG: hypothetical protein GY915_03100 [bacterium]|nr:hypothetical protein [bacterium]
MKKFLCFSALAVTLLASPIHSSSYLSGWGEWALDKVSQTKQTLGYAKEYWDKRGTLGVLWDTGSAVKTLGTVYNPVSVYYEKDPVIREIKLSGLLFLAHMPLDAISEGSKIMGTPLSWILDPIRIVMSGLGSKKIYSVIEQREDDKLNEVKQSFIKGRFQERNSDVRSANDPLQKELRSLLATGKLHTGADTYVWWSTGGIFYRVAGGVGLYTDFKILGNLTKIARHIEGQKVKIS